MKDERKSESQNCMSSFMEIIRVLQVFPESIKNGGIAVIDCPICNGKDTLHCRVAKINKHKAAYCSKCNFNIME